MSSSAGGTQVGYWLVRSPWNSMLAIDEFGPGTRDGNPANGSSNDACGPAAIENAIAAYEHRAPLYNNIGHIRADMLANGHFWDSANAHGCLIEDVEWEIPRRKYVAVETVGEQGGTLSHDVIHHALTHKQAVIFMIYNAQALQGNEQGVQKHFVAVVGYAGDAATGSAGPAFGKLYVLNSDIAGQHGLATGQWMTIDDLAAADPRAYTILGVASTPSSPPASPPPSSPPPSSGVDINGAVSDLHDALKKLGAV